MGGGGAALSQRLRPLLLVAAAAGMAWSAAVALSDGLVVRTPFFDLSSRDPLRPLAVGVVAALTYALRFRTHLSADLRSVRKARWPPIFGATLAIAALVIGIEWGIFVAGGSDGSGYVSQADRWADGSLVVLAPDWAQAGAWENAVFTSAPLGYRPLGSGDLIVPSYSPGLPLLMAAFQKVGGRNAVYYVVPLLAAVAVWVTYLVAARLAGPWAGLLGAFLLLASPTFLSMLVQPMSDLPAAALWGVAIWTAMRGNTVAAGAATALAILIRPNLAPLSVVIALVVIVTCGRRGFMWFVAAAAPGALIIAVVNTQWYGSPLVSGYGSVAAIYSVDRIWPNLMRYGGWLLAAETPWMLLGFTAPLQAARIGLDRRVVTLVAAIFPATAVALYLPYSEFDAWWYLRFMLPAFVPLLAAAGAATVLLVQRVPFTAARVAVVVLTATAVGIHGFRYSDAFVVHDQAQVYRHVAEYVRLLPARAVFVTVEHSGSIRYYSDRDTLRWDLLAPAAIDRAVAFLRARGHDVYLVGFPWELEEFAQRFEGSLTASTLPQTGWTALANTTIYPLAGSTAPP